MLCERCKIREATIKYTEIINGIKTEHNLCSHCAKEMDFGQYSALLDGEFPLGKLLSGLLGLEDDEEETDVRGSVVCPVFDLFINDKMKQLQGSESHKGKHPKYRSTFEKEHPEAAGGSGEETQGNTDCLTEAGSRDSQTAVARKQIKELDAKLKEAVRQEDYELAASYRDQIKELKKEAGIHE